MATTNTLRGLTTVSAPSGRPRPGGLLSIAEVRDVPIGAAELRGYAYDDEAARTGSVWDYGTSAGAPLTGYQAGITTVQALKSFDIYATAEINALFAPTYNPEAYAQARLALNEPWLVEKEFQTDFLVPNAADITPTPGTALRPAVALGLLAEYAAAHYVPLPTYHVSSRGAIVLAEPAGLMSFANGTGTIGATGAPVVIGAGYTGAKPASAAGVTPTASQQFFYLTGSVLLYRSAVDTFRGSQYLDTNGDHAVAIRTYVPSIETFTVAILTDLS